MNILHDTVKDNRGRKIPVAYRFGYGVIRPEMKAAENVIAQHNYNHRRTHELYIWGVPQTMFWFLRKRDCESFKHGIESERRREMYALWGYTV